MVRSPGRAALCFEVARPGELYKVDSGVAKPHRAGAITAPPRVESEGDFLLREKAPPTPKETASYQSTANYIVVIEQLPPPIGRVVRFITAKLACARAYTKVARVYER